MMVCRAQRAWMLEALRALAMQYALGKAEKEIPVFNVHLYKLR